MDSQIPKPTIIRIKRRRDDEPPDALLVESRKKRSRVSDLFEFVETVEEHEFTSNPQYGRDLIARAAAQPKDPSSPSTSSRSIKSTQKHTTHHASPAKRYTILKPTVPSVTSEEDKSIPESPAEGLTMYDAIVDTRTRRKHKEDPAMLNLISGISGLGKEPTDTVTSSDIDTPVKDNKFVVDVYLQRPMPVGWQMPDNVGWLTGLSSAELKNADSDSDSSKDDDDQDSNSEDYYLNDYPDEDPDEAESDHSLSDYEQECSEKEENEEEEDDEEERVELRDLLRSKGIIMRD